MTIPNCISTHTPHAGRNDISKTPKNIGFISTHTPHAGRNENCQTADGIIRISTHTPHAGRNDIVNKQFVPDKDFNSHAPCGAQLASSVRESDRIRSNFNSHAPCGAQPVISLYEPSAYENFNSHAPCGAQRQARMEAFREE